MYNECLQKGCPSMSIFLNNFWSISCSGHNKVKVRNNHWKKTECIRVQKLSPFSFNDFQCFHFLLLTSNDGWKPRSVKTILMLLQHFGEKLTSSFYTDSVSTSQHLKNVSYRSYDLAHCRNHRKFKVPQLAKHHNDTRPLSILLRDRSKHGTYLLAVNRNPDRNGRCVFYS